MFQVFEDIAFVDVEEGLRVDELRKVLPDESVDLIQKSARVENRGDVSDVEIGLKNKFISSYFETKSG